MGHFRTLLALSALTSATRPHCHGSTLPSPGQMKKIKQVPLLVQLTAFIPVFPSSLPLPKGPFYPPLHPAGPQPVSITSDRAPTETAMSLTPLAASCRTRGVTLQFKRAAAPRSTRPWGVQKAPAAQPQCR